MTIDRYLFQSPYSSQVQIGRPDPSVKQEEASNKAAAEFSGSTNQTLQNAQNFKATQIGEAKPTVETYKLLDTYA